jgi:hypothetical protein
MTMLLQMIDRESGSAATTYDSSMRDDAVQKIRAQQGETREGKISAH